MRLSLPVSAGAMFAFVALGLASASVSLRLATAPAAMAQAGAWLERSLPPDLRASLLLAQMTEAEKLSLLSGQATCIDGAESYVPGIPRLRITPLLLNGAGMGVDDLCRRSGDGPATELPAPIAMAATWDPLIAYDDGAVIGREVRDLGFNAALGGDVNIARDPRNGRTYEAEGEDPLLAGTIVGAQLRGTQDQNVLATIKHFAENNEETYRYGQSSNVSERTMREIELRAFQIGIESSDVGAVMCAYNRINGLPACQDPELLDGVLKAAWNYKGFVMTDFGACGSPNAPSGITVPACSTAAAANSGLDQQQPLPSFFAASQLAAAAAARQISGARINEMDWRILRSMFATGAFDHPLAHRPIDIGADAAVAERVEEEAAVLLRNERGALPLGGNKLRSIAVIGSTAAIVPPEGQWPSSSYVVPIDWDTPLGAIRARAHDAAVRFSDGSSVSAATALARSSQVAIVFAKDSEAENMNRPSLALDPGEDNLIDAVARANRQTIVVLETGAPVTMPWLRRVAAVLEAWYPGERAGHAIARLLFGDANPSGRLPITFPVRDSDLPTAGSTLSWPGTAEKIDYNEGLLVGYRWYEAKHIGPLFPFGFGLSYGGRFVYSKLRLIRVLRAAPGSVFERHAAARVEFTVSNRGSRTATDVPQVYVGFPPSVGEPPRRLADWAQVSLPPGAARTITLTLPESAFDYWYTAGNRWRISPGLYEVWVGPSSAQLPLGARLRLR
jgi:beta-glucosidase